MRNSIFLKVLSLFSVSLLICSCATNGVFTSRKYTAGNFKEFKHKATKPKSTEQAKENPVYASTISGLTDADLQTKKTDFTEEQTITLSEQKAKQKVERKAKLKSSIVNPFKEIKEQIRDLKKAKQLQKDALTRKDHKKATGGTGIDNTALMSLILSVLAIICDVIGIALIVATAQYAFILFFVVGLALGITGLVMGTRGLKNHRENNGSILDLIFSIVGTALGGISIILSVYYSIWSLFWIALS